MAKRPVNNLIGLAVLATLHQRPMHPYEIAKILKATGKEHDMSLKWGSFYTVIGNLEKHGLIAGVESSRSGNRPERTTYRITPTGLARLLATIRAIVATPRREPSEFMAAMSFLVHLDPEEAASQLNLRIHALTAEIRDRSTALTSATDNVDRINLIESEYLVAMLTAELQFTRRLVTEIQEGALTWDLKTILRAAAPSRSAAGNRRK